MKLFAIYITNNIIQQCGRTTRQACRPTVLFVWLGNPTTYKGNTFVWKQGRKLASGSMNGKSFTYSYDGNGMRYKKTVNGSTTEYYLNGSQILAEYNSNLKLKVYLYDASGVCGMIYKNNYYFYEKNTLGDIVAVRNASGSIVATYVYDAWGNICCRWNSYRFCIYCNNGTNCRFGDICWGLCWSNSYKCCGYGYWWCIC